MKKGLIIGLLVGLCLLGTMAVNLTETPKQEVGYFDDVVTAKGPVVNVLAYGAKGDGTTDDRAAIQAALDEAKASGQEVFLPTGIYKITGSPLTYDPAAGGNYRYPLRLRGTGTNGTLLYQATADVNCLDLHHMSGWQIDGISVATVAPTNPAFLTTVIFGGDVDRGTMKNCAIRGGDIGIRMNSLLNTFINVNISTNMPYRPGMPSSLEIGTGVAGMWLEYASGGEGCNATTLIGCSIEGGGSYGIYATDFSGLKIFGGTIEGRYHSGLYLHNMATCFITTHFENAEINIEENGVFTTNLTPWTGTNWAWQTSGVPDHPEYGRALHTAGSTAALTMAAATEAAGVAFTLHYTVVGGSAGTITPSFGGVTMTTKPFGSATYSESGWTTSTAVLAFTPSSDFDGALDNVTLYVHPTDHGDVVIDRSGMIEIDSCVGTTISVVGSGNCSIRNCYVSRILIDEDSTNNLIQGCKIGGGVGAAGIKTIQDYGIGTRIEGVAQGNGVHAMTGSMMTTQPENFMLNGGMELWNATNVPAGWGLENLTAVDETGPTLIHGGAHSLKCTASGGATRGPYFNIPLAARNQWITVDFWMYVASGGVSPVAILDYGSGVTSFPGNWGTGVWEHHVFSFDTFTTAYTIGCIIQFRQSEGGVAYFDDVKLQYQIPPQHGTLDLVGATPSVGWGTRYTDRFQFNNPGGVTVTNLADGYLGQKVWLTSANGNTTLDFTANANMVGNGGVDLVMDVSDLVQMIYTGTKWSAIVGNN